MILGRTHKMIQLGTSLPSCASSRVLWDGVESILRGGEENGVALEGRVDGLCPMDEHENNLVDM
jgi:hypothetical protein